MKTKRSRLALVGISALAISLTVGLVSGSAADAKKKKGSRSFTMSNTIPTTIPGLPGPGSVTAKIPIGTLGKKVGKGKVVSLNGITATTTFTGSAGFASNVSAELVAPSGRNANLQNPVGNGANTEVVSGPLTETPNSSFETCVPDTPPPPPPCSDPDAFVGPPYVGTVGNQALLNFSGSALVGTWFIKVTNSGAQPVVLNNIAVTGGTIARPR